MSQGREAGRIGAAGIGGVFIYANNPATLADWYRDYLGIECEHNEAERAYYHEFLHRDYADGARVRRTVWAILPRKPGADVTGQVFMINYRVANLEKFIEHLRARGIAIEKVEDYDYGRFAWITDPEGNRMELFEDKKS